MVGSLPLVHIHMQSQVNSASEGGEVTGPATICAAFVRKIDSDMQLYYEFEMCTIRQLPYTMKFDMGEALDGITI